MRKRKKEKIDLLTMCLKIISAILLFVININFSCINGQTVKAVENNACIISKNVDLHLKNINSNAKTIIKSSNDNCVISLLDTLTNRTTKTDDSKYLASLESFRKVSDGYVSEYFLEIGVKLFYKDFKDYILYIYDKRSLKENYLEKVMIESMSMEMADTDNMNAYKRKVNEFINREIKKYTFSTDQLVYINTIKNKFDPKLFD